MLDLTHDSSNCNCAMSTPTWPMNLLVHTLTNGLQLCYVHRPKALMPGDAKLATSASLAWMVQNTTHTSVSRQHSSKEAGWMHIGNVKQQ